MLAPVSSHLDTPLPHHYNQAMKEATRAMRVSTFVQREVMGLLVESIPRQERQLEQRVHHRQIEELQRAPPDEPHTRQENPAANQTGVYVPLVEFGGKDISLPDPVPNTPCTTTDAKYSWVLPW